MWLFGALAVMAVLMVGGGLLVFAGARAFIAGNAEQRARTEAVQRLATTEAKPAAVEELEKPFRVEAGGQVIDVEVGHAAPLLADWDGDGRPDLLVGQFGSGKLRIHRNEGAASQPKFGAPKWFDGTVPTG